MREKSERVEARTSADMFFEPLVTTKDRTLTVHYQSRRLSLVRASVACGIDLRICSIVHRPFG